MNAKHVYGLVVFSKSLVYLFPKKIIQKLNKHLTILIQFFLLKFRCRIFIPSAYIHDDDDDVRVHASDHRGGGDDDDGPILNINI